MASKRALLIGGGAIVLVVLAAALVWFGPLGGGDDGTEAAGLREGDPATETAQRFAAAWKAGQLDTVAATPESGSIAEQTKIIARGLSGFVGDAPAEVLVTSLSEVLPTDPETGDTVDDGDQPRRVVAGLEVTWPVAGERTWSYDTQVELVEEPGSDADDPTWLVDWTPATLHPQLGDGKELRVVRTAPTRGELLGLDGTPIVGLRPVVYVSIVPGQTADPASTAQQVASLVGVDAASLVERVQAADAGSTVSVVTLRKEAYDQVAGSLANLSGVVTAEDEIPLAPSRDFASALLGGVGPATEEDVVASEGRVALDQPVGTSGLQAAQDAVLGGSPGLSIRAAAPDGAGEPVELQAFPAVEGKSLTITLDPAVQEAAQQALASAPGPAALVAIRPSTGDVLAVANGPEGAEGYNRAMVGSYPPGSTFKVASTLGLLEQGLTPDTVVPCPPTIVVGKEFGNAGGFSLGDVPFRQDFARSCNTAFVAKSRDLPSAQLSEVAAKLGFREIDLGAPLLTPSVPVTDSEAEHASNMIGQGKVTASPFTVALMAASVAAGRSVEPRLIVDPAKPEPVLGEPLPVEQVANLRTLMRAVVTEGSGDAVLGVPGGEVFGKTGTAEFGTEDPPETHAWFAGYQGDVAFAVLVEGGSSGGGVAAPIAATFLTSLAGA